MNKSECLHISLTHCLHPLLNTGANSLNYWESLLLKYSDNPYFLGISSIENQNDEGTLATQKIQTLHYVISRYSYIQLK